MHGSGSARPVLTATIALLAIGVLLVFANLPGGDGSHATSDSGAKVAGQDAQLAARTVPDATPTLQRTIDPSPDVADAWPREFSSGLTEEGVDPEPTRDGFVFIVRAANGTPCARLPIRVEWHKGFGLYGRDRGSTDFGGAFVSTVHAVEQAASVHVLHPELGELQSYEDPLPSAGDPHAIVLVLPELAMLALQLVDLDRHPIAGGNIELAGTGERPPRECALQPVPVTVTTDGDGHASARLPVGPCVASKLAANGCVMLAPETIRLPRDGTSVVLTMLREASRRVVSVTVALPPGTPRAPEVRAFSMPLPEDLARRLGLAAEQEQRQFTVRQDGERFEVAVDPLPWRLVATAPGCQAAWTDLHGSELAAHLDLRPTPPDTTPRTRLVVTVLMPDGKPAGAQVRIHETPDLVHGSDQGTDRDGRVVHELKPGGRICISATKYKFAPAIAGPIDLLPGDVAVTLTLREALSLRGRVVDDAGRPVNAMVVLHRPAEALRALGNDVPAILPDSPSSDTRGTGPDGQFWFDDLYPGEHELWALPEEKGLWPARVRAMPGTDVTLQSGQGLDGLCLLSVTVVDDATGAPLPGCDVKSLGTTDARGMLRAALPPQDGLTLECWVKEHVVTPSGPYRLAPGPQSIALRIAPSAPVFVRVVDGAGAPVHDANLFALDDHGEQCPLMDRYGNFNGMNARLNLAGRTVLRGLPAGAMRLRVERGEARHEVDLAAGAGRNAVFEVRWPR